MAHMPLWWIVCRSNTVQQEKHFSRGVCLSALAHGPLSTFRPSEFVHRCSTMMLLVKGIIPAYPPGRSAKHSTALSYFYPLCLHKLLCSLNVIILTKPTAEA
ncbi:Alpha-galactosidase [Trichinella spiralis]|uniref:Alpha-galactosidase n=1 Tax=Trichinella spiralis TaxID=6334 RepID=A0ABR3K585_TRISP